MKWKSKKAPPADAVVAASNKDAEPQIVDNKKQSISSTQSMPFLRDDNLTFHRFTADVPSSLESRSNSSSSSGPSANGAFVAAFGGQPHTKHSASMTVAGGFARTANVAATSAAASASKADRTSLAVPIWTSSTATALANGVPATPPIALHDPPMYKNSYTMDSHDFQYLRGGGSSRADSVSTDRRKSTQNGSTAKLMLTDDDQTNQQSKCSLLRGVILCLCLNFTYANVVRFPRELDRHGIAFLVPYGIVLLLIGLPIILLEIALGQFLGQGSAHVWRASPILKGASILGRFACWLAAIWTSMQAAVALVYVGELSVMTEPFKQCAAKVRLEAENGYTIVHKPGQHCLLHLLQTPLWSDASGSMFYVSVSVALLILWLLAAMCTYSSRCLRRCLYALGLTSLALLAAQTGWSVAGLLTSNAVDAGQPGAFTALMHDFMTQLAHRFDAGPLADGDLWFAAVVQMLASTGIGIGVWPALTGKFLYKGDAVRTSLVFVSFNVFVCGLAVLFFAAPFASARALNGTVPLPELLPLTAIQDAAAATGDPLFARLLPGLAYTLVVLVAVLQMAIAVYGASRYLPRHPNYALSALALLGALLALAGPRFAVARRLDQPLVGVCTVCALIFDVMAITWIYGAKNIYTDLEFSIGRPILRGWVFMWCVAPLLLTAVLAWWASGWPSAGAADDAALLAGLPRWTPVAVALAVVALVACVQVYDQVDYNCCSMIQEAAQSSTDWGPADPIVRHAWKQWRSVCEDTGQKDFTLRRRGTRDYTHSIKKGQYSRGKYGSGGPATASGSPGGRPAASSVGSNTPNYGGSLYDDSAVDEDGSVEKFVAASGRSAGDGRTAGDFRSVTRTDAAAGAQKQYFYVQSAGDRTQFGAGADAPRATFERQVQPQQQYNNVSKIEIGGSAASAYDAIGGLRSYPKNPLGRMAAAAVTATGAGVAQQQQQHQPSVVSVNGGSPYAKRRQSHTMHCDPAGKEPIISANGEHICWRKFSVNSQEFSTEL